MSEVKEGPGIPGASHNILNYGIAVTAKDEVYVQVAVVSNGLTEAMERIKEGSNDWLRAIQTHPQIASLDYLRANLGTERVAEDEAGLAEGVPAEGTADNGGLGFLNTAGDTKTA